MGMAVEKPKQAEMHAIAATRLRHGSWLALAGAGGRKTDGSTVYIPEAADRPRVRHRLVQDDQDEPC